MQNTLRQFSGGKAIYGMSATQLTFAESAFFKHAKPFGYILFSRNIESLEQVRELTKQLRALTPDHEVAILIDQEGGRVARLPPPLVKEHPPAMHFAELARKDIDAAVTAVYENYKSIAAELIELGIDTNCAPVADLLVLEADNIIGDRSFGADVEVVTKLCEAAMRGLRSGGVRPVVKHIPGHGRAMCDSHLDLPVVDAPLDELERTDFRVFSNLSAMNEWAMTAHILYTALDAQNCVTTSSKAIEYIRQKLGYKGLIMSDDISMKALKGGVAENARAAWAAGCDMVLHCNGDLSEMECVASMRDI